MQKKIPQKQKYELIQLIDWKTIQNVVGCCRNTIYNAIRYTGKIDQLLVHERPSLLKPHHVQFIKARTLGNRSLSNLQLSRDLVNYFDDLTKCSPQTVMRTRHDLGIHFLPVRTNCAVTQASRIKRINWCKEKLSKGIDWTRVVFSDESWFEIGQKKRWVWRHVYDDGPNVTMDKRAHPKKVMIWGAIGANFKSKLIFIDQTIDGGY